MYRLWQAVGQSQRAFEERWAMAQTPQSVSICENKVEDLDGRWQVRRLSGPVPMPGVFKAISNGKGHTGATWSPFPDLPFELEQKSDYVELVYSSPLPFIRDELRREADGSWLGKANIAGVQYAWLAMIPCEEIEARGEHTTQRHRTR